MAIIGEFVMEVSLKNLSTSLPVVGSVAKNLIFSLEICPHRAYNACGRIIVRKE